MDSPGVGTPAAGLPLGAPAVSGPDYKDRSTALVVFGIIEILGGALAALMIPFMLLGMVLARKTAGAGPPGSMAMPLVTYLGLAASLVTLGIGAVMARRWAWALNLILSWLWLITGSLVTVAMIAFMPSSFMAGMRTAAEQNPNAGNMPTGVMAAVLTFFIVLAAIFLVFLPIGFLLFYRSRNTEETCKHRDPVERWTDRRPLPVIAAALLTASGAVYYVVSSFTTPIFPLFGRYLTGWTAAGPLLALALMDGYIAVSFVKMKIAGWWLAIIMLPMRLVSAGITLWRAGLIDAYSRLGWSAAQLQALRASPMVSSRALAFWILGLGGIYLGFIVWLKRYFRSYQAAVYTEPGDGISLYSQPEN